MILYMPPLASLFSGAMSIIGEGTEDLSPLIAEELLIKGYCQRQRFPGEQIRLLEPKSTLKFRRSDLASKPVMQFTEKRTNMTESITFLG